MNLCLVICLLSITRTIYAAEDEEKEDSHGVKPPSKCEVCKILITELKNRLKETESSEVINLGHGLDPKKKKKLHYKTSDLRLIEALQDPHVCDKILEYNVHKERTGSNRFAKGMSETFQTLHGLVNKGVKVDLGIPLQLWDKPSAEVTMMHKKCYQMAEDYEEDIEDWYYNHQDEELASFICSQRVLKNSSDKCLSEVHIPKKIEEDIKDKNGKKFKGEKGRTKKDRKDMKKDRKDNKKDEL